MARYRVMASAWQGDAPCRRGPDAGLAARRVVAAWCARDAACTLAAPYVDSGLVVDWSARRVGWGRLGRRWSGRFLPDTGPDLGGVREPRRPLPPHGVGGIALDLPAG